MRARPARPDPQSRPEVVGPGPYSVVVPSLARASLWRLLRSLGQTQGPPPREVIVVDDRAGVRLEPLDPLPAGGQWAAAVVRGFGRGPAAARNLGWQLTSTPWVVFLDDDVELPSDWATRLVDDLVGCDPRTAGSQGRIIVPPPDGRRPTDWERNTAGLQDAAWATADMAYRRTALQDVGGFDERFPRAYREDADLALRVCRQGWALSRGNRRTVHPVRPAGDWVSIRVQRGNADDALMRRLHGPHWRTAADVPRGRLRTHVAVCAAILVAAAGALSGRRRVAALGGLTWAALTADFARRRIAPGPSRDTAVGRAELRRMLLTSIAIPPVATWHRLRGEWRWHTGATGWPAPVRAVLFDRDGTLVHDVPYNGDPALVKPVDDAANAVRRVRAAGLATAVVTNQSGIARGLLDRPAVDAVNAEIDRLLGPFDTWQVCPHQDGDDCACRKPRPGMVLQAARELGVRPEECVLIGDIGADVEAARACGARAVLVPTEATQTAEIAAAPVVARSLHDAVTLILERW